MNPQENVWQFIRDNWLSNQVFDDIHALIDHCCNAWNKLEAQPWTHHVPRYARLGASVLISESWYKVLGAFQGRIGAVPWKNCRKGQQQPLGFDWRKPYGSRSERWIAGEM